MHLHLKSQLETNLERRCALPSLLVMLAVMLASALSAAQSAPQAPIVAAPPSSAISLSGYRARLQTLDQLVATCQAAPGPANCHADQVGADAEVAVTSGTRQVRFAWMRGLLEEAAKPEGVKVNPTVKIAKEDGGEDSDADTQPDGQSGSSHGLPQYQPPAMAVQLAEARKRLADEMQQVNQLERLAASVGAPVGTASPPRRTLDAILAAREYHTAVAPPSLWQRGLEKVLGWINNIFAKLREAGSKSKWFGYAAEISFGIVVLVALAWFLIRLERQGRLGSNPISFNPGSSAASARDWQLWLDDARKAAAEGAWRDAIHLTYWASISRLESSGLWPADRARTPREYLALLAPDSNQRPALAAITRSFESTWYGNRPAQEADFRQAEEIAAKLGGKLGASPRSAQGAL